jgi:hypothetical protein
VVLNSHGEGFHVIDNNLIETIGLGFYGAGIGWLSDD